MREQSKVLGERLRGIELRLSAADTDDPVATLVDAQDVSATWAAMTLRTRRAVISTLVMVRVLPAGKGVRWDPEQVEVSWVR